MGTIDERYNVIAGGMGKKELYTAALSRSTRLEYIRLDNTEVRGVYCDNVNKSQEQVSIGHSEYQHGKVYKVVFNDMGLCTMGRHVGQSRNGWRTMHLQDPGSAVYMNRNKNLTIKRSLRESTSTCACIKRDKVVLNKRMVYRIRKVELTLNVKVNKSLMARIEKMVAIEDDASNKELMIR